MGSKSSKQHNEPPTGVDIPSEEIEHLQKEFRMARRRSSLRVGVHMEKDNLENHWKHYIGKELFTLYSNYLHQEAKELSFDLFCTLYFKLAKSSSNETAEFIIELLKQNKDAITYNTTLTYVKNIVSSYFMILIALKDEVLHKWMLYEFPNSESTQIMVAESLCQDLKNVLDEEHFIRWYNSNPEFQNLHSAFVHKLFHVPGKQVTYRHQTIEKHLIPVLSEIETLIKGDPFSILSLSDILFLNLSLPEEKQFEWKLCFSTVIHGLAFGKMVRMIVDKGPTIIIIKDKAGHKFGGYASSSWKIDPKFQGTQESFLFSLHPAMQIYEATCYNEHYQYLNSQQQTLPNGLGMGGQFNYFGLWLDADFGKGHCSETCTTYKHYKMLSSKKYFEIDHVEVWVVENIQKDDEDEDGEVRESILDKDAGAKALLEIAGREMASEGYREKN